MVRRLAIVTSSLAAVAALLASSPAFADRPKDDDALRALKQATEDDYLQTQFDAAEKRLRDAIDACGADACTPAVKARLYVGLGSVLAGGKKQLDDAKDAFVEALKINPNAAPDPNLASTEVTFAYEKARSELKLGSESAAVPTTVQHLPPAEQKKHTPVPLYVALPPELAAKTKKVSVTYQPTTGGDEKTIFFRKVRDGAWGIDIPCGDVAKEGTLTYRLLVTDEQNAVLAELGSRESPLKVPIKASIELDPPHWPGFAPPETCGDVEPQHGPSQCIDDHQCNDGFTCVAGACVPPAPAEPKDETRKNWVSVSFVPDVSIISGSEVCTASSQQNDHFVCLRGDKSRYDGVPTTGVADNVKTGAALATMRVVVAFDRLVLDNLAIGARVGYAFGGATDGGASFLPLHIEGRATYYLGKQPFSHAGVRPFVFISGGVAQVDTKQSVQIEENGQVCGAKDPADANSPCTHPSIPGGHVEQRVQTLAVYKQAGEGFVGGGIGVSYAPTRSLALNLGVRGSVTLPVVTAVISPEAGLAVGF